MLIDMPTTLRDQIAADSYDEVEEQLALHPEEAQALGQYNLFSQKSQALPLHYLCRRRKANVSVMRAMIEASPADALIHQDSSSKSTPLHVACWYQLNPDVIIFLVERNKQALLVPDAYGNLPVHLVASFHPQAPELVTLFLSYFPETAAYENGKEQTAVHQLKWRKDVDTKLQKDVLRAYPQKSKYHVQGLIGSVASLWKPR
jgi:hypothetical protein